jgi:energy-coupling factor transporter ATP-binding protein EcfA2
VISRTGPGPAGDHATRLLARLRGVRYSPDPGRAFRISIDRLDLRGPGVVFVGRSGSGKTSLLELLLGLRTPDSGEIALLGARVRRFEDLRWGRVGYLPQFPERLLFAETVGAEVAIGARLLSTEPSSVRERVDRSLVEAGLVPARDRGRSPHRLSFGQRRRVALAAVLSSAPRLLVLDEPSTGLDLAGFRTLRDLLAARRASRLPFLLATHDLDLASEVGSEFVALEGGAVAAVRQEPPDDLPSICAGRL